MHFATPARWRGDARGCARGDASVRCTRARAREGGDDTHRFWKSSMCSFCGMLVVSALSPLPYDDSTYKKSHQRSSREYERRLLQCTRFTPRCLDELRGALRCQTAANALRQFLSSALPRGEHSRRRTLSRARPMAAGEPRKTALEKTGASKAWSAVWCPGAEATPPCSRVMQCSPRS